MADETTSRVAFRKWARQRKGATPTTNTDAKIALMRKALESCKTYPGGEQYFDPDLVRAALLP